MGSLNGRKARYDQSHKPQHKLFFNLSNHRHTLGNMTSPGVECPLQYDKGLREKTESPGLGFESRLRETVGKWQNRH